MRAAGLLNCKNEDGESKRFPKVPASRRGCEAGTSRGSPKITPELQAERVLICKPSRNSRRYREAYRNAWQRASLYAAIGGTIKASSYWGRGFFVIMATVQSQAQLCVESWMQLAEIHDSAQSCIRRARRSSGNGCFRHFRSPAQNSNSMIAVQSRRYLSFRSPAQNSNIMITVQSRRYLSFRSAAQNSQ